MSINAADVKKLREHTQAGMMACKRALEETQGDFQAAIDLLRKNGEVKAAKIAGKAIAEGRVLIAANGDNTAAMMVEVNCQTDFVGRDENFVAFSDQLAEAMLKNNIVCTEKALTLKPNNNHDSFDAWRKELINKIGENIQLRRAVKLDSKGAIGQYCHSNRIGVLVALDKADEALARDIAMHIAASNPLAITPDEVSADLIAKEKEIFTAQAQESGKPANIIEKMVAGRVSKFLKEVALVEQPFVKDPDLTIAQLLKQKGATVTAFQRYELGEGVEIEQQDFAAEVMAQIKN